MINKTIRSTGDFVNIKAAWDWCKANAPLTDDYTFTICEDITEDVQMTQDISVIGNHTIIFTSDISHLGDPNAGRKIYLGFNIGLSFSLSRDVSSSKPTLILEKLNIIKNAMDSLQAPGIYLNIVGGANTEVYNLLIQDIIINGNGNSASGAFGFLLSWQLTEGLGISIVGKNIKIFNYSRGFSAYAVGYQDDVHATFENMTIYNCSEGIVANGLKCNYCTLRNVVVCKSNIGIHAYMTPGYNDYIFDHCADNDNTLPPHTGVIHNIISANEFQSLDDTNSKFLFLKENTYDFSASPLSVNPGELVQFTSLQSGNGQLYNSGSTSILSISDIVGNARPNSSGKVCIGAHERNEITDFLWDFGDGLSSTLENPAISYSIGGSKDIRLDVAYFDESHETIDKPAYIYINPIGFPNLYIIDQRHDWAKSFSIKYKFETVFALSRKNKEQRRPLKSSSQRIITFNIFEEETEKFFNQLKYLHAEKQIVVPIYSEIVTFDGTGTMFLETDFVINDTSYLYNLIKRTGYILFTDIRGIVYPDYFSIKSVSGASLLLNTQVNYAFYREYTKAYPCILGHISNLKRSHITDTLSEIEVEIEEHV
jgi:PKD repeat protein